MPYKLTISLFVCVLTLFPLSAQTHKEALQRITQFSDSTSAIMHTVSMLSDVYGPRFMGTPQYYESALYIQRELKSWGIDQVSLHSFDQQYVGWSVEDFSVKMIQPTVAFLRAYPLAYTGSTEGLQSGTPIAISSFDEIFTWADSLQGKIILLKGYYRPVTSVERPMSTRFTKEQLTAARANPDPNDVLIGYHSRRSSKDVFAQRARIKEQRKAFFEFCREQGVLAVFEPSNMPYGMLHADGNRAAPSFSRADEIKLIPSFVLSNEHFGRLLRLMDMGIYPELEIKLKTRLYETPEFNVNLIAEIPGTDPILKEEVVIIGAHLDSWHAGTGAVDNASNCAVMMEAMRIIQQTALRPKRSIRLILWGGEEQIFAGSSAYVQERVGDFATGQYKAEQENISAMLNLDNGAGKIRGIYLSGNEFIKPYFSEYLAPFPASQTLTLQNANQTDHELFDYFNVPAFQFIQDPLDYISAIHHTDMDLFEYVPEADQQYNAKVIAYMSYRLAQETARMPRKVFNSPLPSRKGNTTFNLPGFSDAKQVSLVGNFNKWNMFGTPLYKTADGWTTKIDLPKGRYYYKFIVDGYWTADPQTPEDKLVKDGKGHGGVTVRVVR